MSDLKIPKISSFPLEKAGRDKGNAHDPISDFKKALGKSTEEVNRLLKEGDLGAQEMVMGKQDIHQTMIAMEQANLSLRLMLQVRNKMIAAYEEIMRMQF